MSKQIKELKKAFGGCTKCYGKGYSTEWVGETTIEPDFDGDKRYLMEKAHSQIHFCDCDRGKQLEKLFSSQREQILGEMEKILKDDKAFQKWAIQNYVKDYYEEPKNKFLGIKRPENVAPEFRGIPNLNFDAEYENKEFKERWKINFLVANSCVKKALKKVLDSLSTKGGEK